MYLTAPLWLLYVQMFERDVSGEVGVALCRSEAGVECVLVEGSVRSRQPCTVAGGRAIRSQQRVGPFGWLTPAFSSVQFRAGLLLAGWEVHTPCTAGLRRSCCIRMLPTSIRIA